MVNLHDEDDRFTLWIVSVIIGYILGILQIYGVWKFYHIKHLIIVIKRYPFIVLIESIATIFYLLIAFPGIGYTILSPKPLSILGYHEFFNYINYVVYPFSGHFIVIAEFARLWLIFFDLNYLNCTKNEVWKSKINKKQYSEDNNFYLKNRNKFGNQKWIIQRFLIF